MSKPWQTLSNRFKILLRNISSKFNGCLSDSQVRNTLIEVTCFEKHCAKGEDHTKADVSENVNVTHYLRVLEGRTAISDRTFNEWLTSMTFNMDVPWTNIYSGEEDGSSFFNLNHDKHSGSDLNYTVILPTLWVPTTWV